MKLGTRLIAALLPSIAVVMAAYAIWAVDHRQAALTRLAENESRAYAAVAGAAFENALRDREFGEVQELLDEISHEPRIHGVLVYRPDGRASLVSAGLAPEDAAPVETVDRVVEAGSAVESHRRVAGREVFSVLRPLRDAEGRISGLLEVTQPLSFVHDERGRTQRQFLFNTLTLLVVVGGLTIWLVRRFVTGPLDRLVEGIRGLGDDLSHRVPTAPGGTELAALAHEFNRMADRLGEARRTLLRQADERVEVEQQMRETEKLAAVGTVAAGIAHQIASPLNVIAGRSRLLRDRAADETEERNLRVIGGEAERIRRVVRTLLDFAARPDASVRRTDLASGVRLARELLKGEIEQAGIEFELAGEDEVWVESDPELLREVFVILLMNGVQALQETEPGHRRLEVRTATEAARAVVEVSDTGPGIDPADRERVFDPFYTTKAGGTGLGLAVARRIVEQLDGSIEVAAAGDGARAGMPEGGPDAERGATVRITLPLAEPSGEGGGDG